jgi:ABC-2 type transport system permease protein
MKVWLIARKSLVETVREAQLLVLTIALPLIFLGITYLTYNAELLRTHEIWVFAESVRSEEIIQALEGTQYANGAPVFKIVNTADLALADQALKTGEIAAFVQLEDDASSEGDVSFEDDVSFENDPVSKKTTATIHGDALSNDFYLASTTLENTFRSYAREAAGKKQIVAVTEQPMGNNGPQSEFDLYAPGMITFGLLMIIPQTAMLVSREVRWKTLNRIRLTRVSAWDLLGGISLAQILIAIAQVMIVLLAAIVLGFNNQGSLGLAILVGLAICASAIGQGLLVACFSQDDSQAANVGSTFSMIQVFLSGSFYQLPPLTMFSLAGHQIDVFDIFPATHGFRALQQVLTYGDGLSEIGFRLGATLLLSMVYFAIGVIVFQKTKMGRR